VDRTDTRPPEATRDAAERHVTALYQAHALSLARLALLMLGDADAAQDVVQDAFLNLYRRWNKLASADAAPRPRRRPATARMNCAWRTRSRRRRRPGSSAASSSR
jgi:DNA-directed RNA polymerase specialized sigma24 family protein